MESLLSSGQYGPPLDYLQKFCEPLLVQVEENGEPAEQRAILPSHRIFTDVLLTLLCAGGGKWRVC